MARRNKIGLFVRISALYEMRHEDIASLYLRQYFDKRKSAFGGDVRLTSLRIQACRVIIKFCLY